MDEDRDEARASTVAATGMVVSCFADYTPYVGVSKIVVDSSTLQIQWPDGTAEDLDLQPKGAVYVSTLGDVAQPRPLVHVLKKLEPPTAEITATRHGAAMPLVVGRWLKLSRKSGQNGCFVIAYDDLGKLGHNVRVREWNLVIVKGQCARQILGQHSVVIAARERLRRR